jgi:hypothetical protein
MITYIVCAGLLPECGSRYRSLQIGAIREARYGDDSPVKLQSLVRNRVTIKIMQSLLRCEQKLYSRFHHTVPGSCFNPTLIIGPYVCTGKDLHLLSSLLIA